MTFDDFKFGPAIRRGIAAAGFVEPRPIQVQCIPAALEGRDILGLAQTGTGKTAAFALPLLERLLAGRGAGPRVLIVAPTRELATQIAEEIRSLARFTSVTVATIFGGVSAHSQVLALRNRPDIIVGCPGRLLDLLGQKALRLDRIESLVLDEADHMFDMGFLPDVRRLLAALPAKRQNLLFSATMPSEIRRLANQLLDRPQVVELAHSRPASTIEHALYPVDEGRKQELLERILGGDDFVSAIVFTRTKHRAKRLAQKLAGAGHRAVALQGNMSQNARTRAMDGFRKREYDVLVATDIAARGLDVEQVSHVVNFDLPMTPDAYTHRIGRTGRSEREGKAYTFVTSEDHAMVREVEARIGAEIPRRKLPGFETLSFPAQGASRPGARSGNAGRGHSQRGSGGAGSHHGSRPASAGRGQGKVGAAGGGSRSGSRPSGAGRSEAERGAAVAGSRPTGAAPGPRRRRPRRRTA